MAAHKASKRYVTNMTVEARVGNPFPIDMLRYDRCVPASEGDASAIAYTFDTRYDPEPRTVKIALVRYGSTAYPINGERRYEYGRWESFGWKVVSEEQRYEG